MPTQTANQQQQPATAPSLNLNPDIRDISLDDMLRAVGRELGMRRAKYPQWVKRRQMTADVANHEIACISAVYAKLKQLQQSPQPAEPLQGPAANLRAPS
jgi:hypothetical protein